MTLAGSRTEKPARRLLLLSPFAPHHDAIMGGPVVIAGLISALSRYERIALLYLRDPEEPPLDPLVAQACEITMEVPRPAPDRSAVKALSVLRGTPSWVADWHVPEFSTKLQVIVREWQPDIVQAEFHLMCQYIPGLGPARPPVVLNQHEPGTEAIRDRRRAGLVKGRFMPSLEERAWRRYERKLQKWVNAVVVFTERDREAVRGLCPNTRIEVISPGTPLRQPALSPTGHGKPALLFFGNYLHAPNVDAALRLARCIVPLARQQTPDLALWLPGDQPPEELRQLGGEGVVVPGRVADLTPYLDSAAAVIVPLRLGGGMRVKVIETLAAGKPLIASRLAVDGLNLVDGEHVLLAETDAEFAEAATSLLADPGKRAALGQRGREWARDNLSWDRSARQYVALHGEVIAERVEVLP
jgi:polysaccharide biosynthesis protein PslH